MKFRIIASLVVVLAIAGAFFLRGGVPAGTSVPHTASTPASGGINLGQ